MMVCDVQNGSLWYWLEKEVDRLNAMDIPWTAETQGEAVDNVNAAFRRMAA